MTFSRLTLGEPRLKSKLRGGEVTNEPPCSVPTVTGSNLAPDGGFENWISNTGQTQLPVRSFTNSPTGATFPDFYFPDGTLAAPFDGGEEFQLDWFQRETWSDRDLSWFVTDVNPDSGTYHLRNTSLVADWTVMTVIPGSSYWICEASDGTRRSYPYWRASQGMIIDFSLRARKTRLTFNGNNPNPLILGGVDYYDSDFTHLSSDSVYWQHSTGGDLEEFYQTYSVSAVVPSGVTWVHASFWNSMASGSFGDDHHFDVDNVSLSIS